jgi:hypothetical protein
MKSARLLVEREGRDKTRTNVFIDAARGHAKTLTFMGTESRNSICGGHLDPAWVEGNYTYDPGRQSFLFNLFTLKNHLDVVPTKVPMASYGIAAYLSRDSHVMLHGAD